MFKTVTQCPISFDGHSVQYLDLGMMPLVNNLCDTREESFACKKYPLAVNYYPKSGLSVLSAIVNPEILFSNYLYKSGVNKPYIEHCKEMFYYINKFVRVKTGDVFLDIGGNDGSLLKTFQSLNNGIFGLNIDPAKNLGKISRESGISTLDYFWSSDVAKNITECKVITSTNVFQHNETLRDFAFAVRNTLTNDGIWCLEFPYWKKNLETHQFDQVYHEHIYYYMVTPIEQLFRQVGLEIIDISEHSIHGGTMRIISRKKKRSITKRSIQVKEYIKKEALFDENYHINWGKEIMTHITLCKRFLKNLKTSGKEIAAFGAAAKGCIFLNSAGITNDTISYIVDDTDTKWNKFVPGTGIQVVSRDVLIDKQPDILVILAHNFADYIVKSVKPIYKGKFVVMFPAIAFYE